MKKDIPYREQLLELSKLYKVPEVKSYIKSKKNLTTSQLELILLKNKIPLPAQSYSRKHVAEIKFKEQVITNLILTIALLGFITSLITIRPYIKIVTDEIKFTHVAKEYKSNFTGEKQLSKKTGKEKICQVWPNLELYMHGGISMQPYKKEFDEIIGSKINYLEIYNASEGFFGIKNNLKDDDLLLMLDY